jgi:hypothetical protein
MNHEFIGNDVVRYYEFEFKFYTVAEEGRAIHSH